MTGTPESIKPACWSEEMDASASKTNSGEVTVRSTIKYKEVQTAWETCQRPRRLWA